MLDKIGRNFEIYGNGDTVKRPWKASENPVKRPWKPLKIRFVQKNANRMVLRFCDQFFSWVLPFYVAAADLALRKFCFFSKYELLEAFSPLTAALNSSFGLTGDGSLTMERGLWPLTKETGFLPKDAVAIQWAKQYLSMIPQCNFHLFPEIANRILLPTTIL